MTALRLGPNRRVGTTRLSWVSRPTPARSGLFVAMARLSLVLGLTSMLTGCVIEDPPPYTQPRKTAPRLDLLQAVPGIDRVIVVSQSDTNPPTVQLTVPVSSEDAGEELTAFLLLNYEDDGTAADSVDDATIRPGTLDEAPRTIELDWTIPSKLIGCQRLTVIVSHTSNFAVTALAVPRDKADAAKGVWWLNITPAAGSGGAVQPCPPTVEVAP